MWLFLSQVYFIYLFFPWSVYFTDSFGGYPLSSSLYNIPLRTFYSAGLVVMNCSVFSLKYPISLSFLTDNPAGYRIFGSQVFVFRFVCLLFCTLKYFILCSFVFYSSLWSLWVDACLMLPLALFLYCVFLTSEYKVWWRVPSLVIFIWSSLFSELGKFLVTILLKICLSCLISSSASSSTPWILSFGLFSVFQTFKKYHLYSWIFPCMYLSLLVSLLSPPSLKLFFCKDFC